jgi:fused signal recognition particle receptor
MFDKLKKAFSGAAKSLGQKEISEKDLDNTLLDLQIALLESDVAQEVVDSLSAKLKKDLLGLKLEKGQDAGQIIESNLQEAVASIFARAGKIDLVEKINAKKAAKAGPFVIVFLGINGTGKTTTVAKVANLLRKSGITVVVAAGDTHRAGAIEQLSQHAERLSLKVIAQRYGADPSAVGRDAVDYAKKHYVDAVLIDTAGRMQTSKNLMDEMAKIVRVVKPDVKLFVGDSLAGNDTINQAREFFQYTNFDAAILTKIDADAKGGAAISIAHIASRPIAYVGVGQGYDDMIPFDPDKFIQSLFGTTTVSVENLISASVPSSEALEPAIKTEKKIEEMPAPAPVAASTSPIGAPVFRSYVEEEKAKPTSAQPMTSASYEQPEKDKEYSPPPQPVQQPKPPAPPPQPVLQEEPKEEKKGRFGLFGRKKDDKKEEEEKRKEEERRRKEEEEKQRAEAKKKEKEEKKKRKDDKEKKEDVVYLTDEDIEDLLK